MIGKRRSAAEATSGREQGVAFVVLRAFFGTII
jgi:hypothetical protein